MYKPAILFFAKLVGIYALLLAPWPGVEEWFSRSFSSCADYMTYGYWNRSAGDLETLGIFGTDAVARVYSEYQAADPGDPATSLLQKERDNSGHDLLLVTGNISKFAFMNNRSSSRHLGYVPGAVLLALVLASPVSWKRRAFASVAGMLLTLCFVFARFSVLMLYLFHGDKPQSVYQFEAPWDWILVHGYHLLAVVPATAYVVPLFLWGLVTFRKSDLTRLTDWARSLEMLHKGGR